MHLDSSLNFSFSTPCSYKLSQRTWKGIRKTLFHRINGHVCSKICKLETSWTWRCLCLLSGPASLFQYASHDSVPYPLNHCSLATVLRWDIMIWRKQDLNCLVDISFNFIVLKCPYFFEWNNFYQNVTKQDCFSKVMFLWPGKKFFASERDRRYFRKWWENEDLARYVYRWS